MSNYFFFFYPLSAKRHTLILMVFLFLLFYSAESKAEIQYAKVTEITGSVEMLRPFGKRWGPLVKGSFLKKGSKVRTQSASSVQIVFDDKFESIARLEENSRLDFLADPPLKVFLERGELLVLRESESAAKINLKKLQILTRDALVQFYLGGCAVQTSFKGTWVKVFDEKAEVTDLSAANNVSRTRSVVENFKFFIDRSASERMFARMKFEDYDRWQQWIKKCYETKDDLAADSLEKELAA